MQLSNIFHPHCFVAEMKRAITPKTRGVVFDDDEDDKSKIKSKVSQTSKSG